MSSTTILHSMINHEKVLLNKARSIFTVMCMTGGKDIIGVTAWLCDKQMKRLWRHPQREALCWNIHFPVCIKRHRLYRPLAKIYEKPSFVKNRIFWIPYQRNMPLMSEILSQLRLFFILFSKQTKDIGLVWLVLLQYWNFLSQKLYFEM